MLAVFTIALATVAVASVFAVKARYTEPTDEQNRAAFRRLRGKGRRLAPYCDDVDYTRM